MGYHLVRLVCGPAWQPNRSRRQQDGWDQHAAYLDQLTTHGVVVLGGPVGNVDTGDAVLVVEAFDQAAVLALLAGDPWWGSVLTLRSIEPWSIWLRATASDEVELAG
jgi:uncharacterized protein YciI